MKAGDHGRYFLTQTRTSTGIDRIEAEEQSAPVKVYSPAAGMIVVSALGGEKNRQGSGIYIGWQDGSTVISCLTSRE